MTVLSFYFKVMKEHFSMTSNVVSLMLCRYGEKRFVTQREALPTRTECHY